MRPLLQVVRGQLYSDFVARQDADIVLRILPEMCAVTTCPFSINAEHGVRQRIKNGALHFNIVFFGHRIL